MTPEDNPADDDPHGECRHEIQRLQAENLRINSAFGPPGSPCPWKDTGELVAENANLREQITLIIGSLEWTGDGYEWTGGEYDYRLKPSEAVQAMQLDRERLRTLERENTKLRDGLWKCPQCSDGIIGTDYSGEAIDCHYCGGSGWLEPAAFIGTLERFHEVAGDLQAADFELGKLRAELAEHLETILRVSAVLGGERSKWNGWIVTDAPMSADPDAAIEAGDRLVELGFYERHPDGHGRRQFYRKKV